MAILYKLTTGHAGSYHRLTVICDDCQCQGNEIYVSSPGHSRREAEAIATAISAAESDWYIRRWKHQCPDCQAQRPYRCPHCRCTFWSTRSTGRHCPDCGIKLYRDEIDNPDYRGTK